MGKTVKVQWTIGKWMSGTCKQQQGKESDNERAMPTPAPAAHTCLQMAVPYLVLKLFPYVGLEKYFLQGVFILNKILETCRKTQ